MAKKTQDDRSKDLLRAQQEMEKWSPGTSFFVDHKRPSSQQFKEGDDYGSAFEQIMEALISGDKEFDLMAIAGSLMKAINGIRATFALSDKAVSELDETVTNCRIDEQLELKELKHYEPIASELLACALRAYNIVDCFAVHGCLDSIMEKGTASGQPVGAGRTN